VHGFFQDITERKRVEEELRRLNETLEQHVAERTAALRASEERFRRVFEHAAEGIAITDLEGRFVQCNAAYAAIVGYTEQELRALQFESLIHPDDRLQNMELVRQLMSGEVPSFEVDNRYVTKSGRPAWVHKHVSMLRNDQGEPTHLMALVTDITKRKHIEAALRTVQARQHLLLTATPVVLYSRRVTPDYGVTFISENVMEQLGYSPQDFASNSSFWLNHLHPDDRRGCSPNSHRCLNRDGMGTNTDSSVRTAPIAGCTMSRVSFVIRPVHLLSSSVSRQTSPSGSG
jgi:PAS domain S-box-containing protein